MIFINRRMAGIMLVLLLFLADSANAETNIANKTNNAENTGIHESISSPGYRYVWEEGMENILTLTPLNSDIFYYDIDSGAGGELMNIDIGDPSKRTIDVDNLTYHTSTFNISFRYRGFGNYSAIGFLGEKYLAAYTNDSKIASKPVNLLDRRILSKILIDENINHSLIASSIKKKQYGENILLSDGYELRLSENPCF